MSTFAQTPQNDLSIVNGQLVLVTDVATEAAIELRNKFLFIRGEYFLDTRQGAPLFTYVFVKNPDLPLIRQLFHNIIKSAKGIATVDELNVSFDVSKRKLTFSFSATAADGQTVTGGSDRDFIVEP